MSDYSLADENGTVFATLAATAEEAKASPVLGTVGFYPPDVAFRRLQQLHRGSLDDSNVGTVNWPGNVTQATPEEALILLRHGMYCSLFHFAVSSDRDRERMFSAALDTIEASGTLHGLESFFLSGLLRMKGAGFTGAYNRARNLWGMYGDTAVVSGGRQLSPLLIARDSGKCELQYFGLGTLAGLQGTAGPHSSFGFGTDTESRITKLAKADREQLTSSPTWNEEQGAYEAKKAACVVLGSAVVAGVAAGISFAASHGNPVVAKTTFEIVAPTIGIVVAEYFCSAAIEQPPPAPPASGGGPPVADATTGGGDSDADGDNDGQESDDETPPDVGGDATATPVEGGDGEGDIDIKPNGTARYVIVDPEQPTSYIGPDRVAELMYTQGPSGAATQSDIDGSDALSPQVLASKAGVALERYILTPPDEEAPGIKPPEINDLFVYLAGSRWLRSGVPRDGLIEVVAPMLRVSLSAGAPDANKLAGFTIDLPQPEAFGGVSQLGIVSQAPGMASLYDALGRFKRPAQRLSIPID